MPSAAASQYATSTARTQPRRRACPLPLALGEAPQHARGRPRGQRGPRVAGQAAPQPVVGSLVRFAHSTPSIPACFARARSRARARER